MVERHLSPVMDDTMSEVMDELDAEPDRFVRQKDLVPRDRLISAPATIVGVGAIGRQVALQLAAIGVPKLQIIDFDDVTETNITTQGYSWQAVGRRKVSALEDDLRYIDNSIDVDAVCERYRSKIVTHGAVFCCVDSIAARGAVWRGAGQSALFLTDGRMLAEVIRVITVADEQSRRNYPTTLFAEEETQAGSCTSKSTIYTASLAAALMVHQFTRWLRNKPTDFDLMLNLMASELTVQFPA